MIKIADHVRKKRNPGMSGIVVSGPDDDCGDIYWSVRLPDGRVQKWLEETLEPVPVLDSIRALLENGAFGTRSDFSRLVTFHRLNKPLSDNIYSLHATKTDFYAYQFKPLLKFFDSPNQRLLIADEVGLGKTIEAGIILTELRARTRLQRVLVICPAALCQKWRWEMFNRFSEDFIHMNKRDFLGFLDLYKENSGQIPVRAICSMQSLRSRDVLEKLEEVDPVFDLVIVDEAHHMRNPCLTQELGRAMSLASEAFLMLTATPVQTGHENLFNLLSVMDRQQFNDQFIFSEQLRVNKYILKAEAALSEKPFANLGACREAFDEIKTLSERERRWFINNPMWEVACKRLIDIDLEDRESVVDLRRSVSELNLLGSALSRTRKREVIENAPIRKPKALRVRFTEIEMSFYERVTEYIRNQYSFCSSSFEKFILMMPQRLAASCIPATIEHYFGGQSEDIVGADYLGSLGDDAFDGDDDWRDVDIQTVLTGFEKGIEHDSKYEALIEYLVGLDSDEKILLFSTFPGTLKYLSKRLIRDGVESRIIHGGIEVDERARRVEQFRDLTSCRVLLTSEVGGEGLDFQFCSVLVNYDLPWNPMVVEQRIGRVDRLGQKSDSIRIVNFSVEGTIDGVILDRLYTRLKIFENTIGLNDGVLGDIVLKISDVLMSQQLSDQDRMKKFEEEAQAIINKLKESECLKDQSSNIMVSDQFLDDEIRRADDLHRYVSGEEVKTMVMDFIKKYFPSTRFREEDVLQTYTIWPNENLKSEIRNFVRDPGEILPVSLLHDRGAKITFDAKIAEKYSDIEYIHVHHPLVRIIISHYRKNPRDFCPTACFRVKSDAIKSGEYLFSLHRLDMNGIRDNTKLIPVFCDMRTKKCLPPDDGEKLFSAMISFGRDFASGRRPWNSDLITDSYETAAKECSQRCSLVIQSTRDRDKAFRARREAHLSAYFEKRIHRQRELAQIHIYRGSSKSVIKGFETRADNLEQERDAALDEVRNGRPFDPSSEELIAGVVHVET
jgi:superfamily II DNA or RNA helicase